MGLTEKIFRARLRQLKANLEAAKNMPLEVLKSLMSKGYKYNGKGYINAKNTVKEAKSLGLTVCEYVENLWGMKGQTDEIITELRSIDALEPCKEVCEIGPGTGRYLERILSYVQPDRYHIYETAPDWARYLEVTYSPVVLKHDADGHTLQYTNDDSCGLVTAFGVFVYLPVLNSFEYFREMIRVCREGGYIVFDCFLDDSWNEMVVQKRLTSGETYPILLPIRLVIDFFEGRGVQIDA